MRLKGDGKRTWLQMIPTAVAVLVLGYAQTGHAQISKGNQILINRGLQVQGMITSGDVFHLSTYSNANYTSINWLWDSNPSLHGTPPGFPWSRWARNQSEMPPLGSEGSYTTQLVTLQLGDEANMNDGAIRTNAINWFSAVRSNWPSTILYVNNFGGQVNDTNLYDFYVKAQPDMLCFDTYPWHSVYDINQPNHTGPVIGGPPTTWYSDLRRYREHAKGANLPLATYRQTFHAVQDYDSTVYRDPSPSELRLNTFAALAFNAKTLIDFTYNTGASSLFTNAYGGDNAPNALYYEHVNINLRARNLGQALVRLKPIADAVPQSYTTSIMFIRGKNSSGTPNAIPISFLADPEDPSSYTDWAYQRNDPYLTNNWVVTNKGAKNNGQPGDVIVSWFKPLDETFDGLNYTNEIYMMVVNGLSDPTGTAADCLQEIQLNFRDAFVAVEMLNPLTGQVQIQALALTNGLRQLVLNLNGGDAALFKFSDGAPFVGAQIVGPPLITSQPASRTNTAGTDATFSVMAAGSSPLSYRWQFNEGNIGGATTNSYTRTNVQAGHAGSYTVVVTNAMGSVTSAVATLIVHVPPQITTQPQSRTVNEGSNVLFSVAATGIPSPTYQWRFNSNTISGATASTYTRTNAQSSDAGSYSVVVSNIVGTATSSNAILMVNGPPSITAQPQNRAALTGGTANFSVTAVGTGPLSYQWRKDLSPLTDGGNLSGTATLMLTISNVQQADLGTYTVAVSNAYGGVISAPATLSIATTPTIQTQPQNRTNNAGTTATFNVVASGNGLIYQWRRNSTNLPNGGNIAGTATDTLVLSAVTKADASNYTVVISNAAGSVTSAPVTLTVLYPLPWREPFIYTPGDNLAGQTSPNFLTWADVGTNTAGAYVTVHTDNLTVTNLAPATGNSIRFGGLGKSARLSFPNPFTTGTVFYSFALKVVDLAGASTAGGFIAGFNNSTGTQGNQPTAVGTRVYLRTTNGGFNIGLSKSSSMDTEWVWHGTVFNTNQTILLVGSYTFTSVGNSTDDFSRLWINPSAANFGAANPPAASLINAAGSDIPLNQIASFVFFQRSTAVEPAVMIADELRVDTSWAGVTPGPAPVRINSIVLLPDGRVRLQGSGDPGNFAIEGTTNFVSWSELTNIPTTNGTFEYIDPVTNLFQRFYRAKFSP